jgi:hypothetical protein
MHHEPTWRPAVSHQGQGLGRRVYGDVGSRDAVSFLPSGAPASTADCLCRECANLDLLIQEPQIFKVCLA